MTDWAPVETALQTAKAIAWDGCHKIYLAMDNGQVDEFTDDDYPITLVTDPVAALATVQDWYDNSCGLRFVSAVRTVNGDPNDGFDDLISQFADED